MLARSPANILPFGERRYRRKFDRCLLLYGGKDAQCLGVSFEAPVIQHQSIENVFAVVAKRWVANIVRKTGKLN
jgi:hypothetical protein